MKITFITFLLTFSAFASENDLFNGASSVRPTHHELSVKEENGYYNASSDVKLHVRKMASEKKSNKEISMGNDSYFTGASN